ncbi:MAG: 23S rRNA (pseudouridine(1915)-N(3))-methyltransferase RlmH [Clostridia bacterium]
MLTIKIIALGTLKEKYLKDAVKEYEKRLSAFCKLKIIELPEAKTGDSEALINKALKIEADAIINAIGKATTVPMCIEGQKMSSEKLAEFIAQKTVMGESTIAFVIGSSHGLHSEIKALGKGLSISDMTFPHQLFRVMLLEQIYRAFQIQTGTKYHK